MKELTLERHDYQNLGVDFYVAGFFVQSGELRLGPFKSDQDALDYAFVFKQIEPTAELHLWPLLGITALKETPDGN